MSTRRVLHLLLLIEFALVLLVARQWAYVTTYRLFLERAIGGARSASTQQFNIDGRRVVTRIVTRSPERLLFESPPATPLVIEGTLQAMEGPVRYALTWHEGGSDRVLEAGVVTQNISISRQAPASGGVLELDADGPVAWIDFRFVRGMRVARHLVALLLLTLAAAVVTNRVSKDEREHL